MGEGGEGEASGRLCPSRALQKSKFAAGPKVSNTHSLLIVTEQFQGDLEARGDFEGEGEASGRILVLEIEFLYCGKNSCTGDSFSVLGEEFLYWRFNFCTGGRILVLEIQFLYWGLHS